MKAEWNDTVIAESDDAVVVDGNHYFPHDSVKWEYFEKTDRTTSCPWKGKAVYFTIRVNDKKIENAAWSYPEPKEAAGHIKGHVAFYGSVTVS